VAAGFQPAEPAAGLVAVQVENPHPLPGMVNLGFTIAGPRLPGPGMARQP
jgi:hypothetical protein